MSDTILEKVRKLLTKAEDPACLPAEAEAFTAKATELIAKYGVDRALLAARDPTSDAVGDRMILIQAPYALEKASLLQCIAKALRCRTVQVRDMRVRVHIFGYGSDLDRAELLYTSLLVQAAQALAATPVPWGQHAAAFRRSWLTGFTSAVTLRLWRAEEDAAHRASGGLPSMALVLADRSEVVERRKDDVYPRTETLKPRRLSGNGNGFGWAAGRRADLGAVGVGARAPRELG